MIKNQADMSNIVQAEYGPQPPAETESDKSWFQNSGFGCLCEEKASDQERLTL